MVVESSKGRGN